MQNIFVSVIMPIYNEEKYIVDCIESLLQQDYPIENMEWIFVDGGSNDNTKELMHMYIKRYPNLIKLMDNPHKTVPYAMNIGINAAAGEYIIRLDAHAEYENDYIKKCVYYLNTTDADNVGGVAETKGRGFVGRIIAKMLSSKFGVGNSQFRTNGKSGYVDTVPFGAFRKEVFHKFGGYDERLTRNQDNEMNYRIRKNGGKIYMAEDIHLTYYCRDIIKGISKMAMQNGKWNVITMKLCPGAMGIRHFIPLIFVLSVLGLMILGCFWNIFLKLLGLELLIYFSLDMLFSIKIANSFREAILLFALFPIFHVTYGVGSFVGITKVLKREFV